jgi:hypothetical protein
MTDKDTLLFFDAATKEEIERELTTEELAQQKADQANDLAWQTQIQARIEARSAAVAKLAALGLTEEEIAAL